ncbi:MAG: phosphoribosylanthranilate isomerase [Candidatus Sumerlaeia bacterium]|nr:phosphoribosylanthranilate isomerase [Candidatus Sumerlaeia bacterium]
MTPATYKFPPPTRPPHVKVCGLTRLADIRLAHDLGASFFGLIFARVSKRRIGRGEASRLVAEARAVIDPGLAFIGVFMDEEPDEIAALHNDLDLAAVQIHGFPDQINEELPVRSIIPAVGISHPSDGDKLETLTENFPIVMADASVKGQSGGTGRLFDHRIVTPFFESRRIILAGGLNPENIADVVKNLAPGPFPYAFDLSSGVEDSPGKKSPEKLRAFFAAYRGAFATLKRDKSTP